MNLQTSGCVRNLSHPDRRPRVVLPEDWDLPAAIREAFSECPWLDNITIQINVRIHGRQTDKTTLLIVERFVNNFDLSCRAFEKTS